MTAEYLLGGVLLGGILFGAILVLFLKRGDAARFERELTDLRTRNQALEENVTTVAREKGEVVTELARTQAAFEAAEKSNAEKLAELTRLREQIEKELKSLTAQALQNNQESFLQIANEVFGKHHKQAETGLQSLITPLATTLNEYKTNLESIEKSRQQAYGNLSAELKNVVQTQTEVRKETSKLVNALRASPKTRGRWGEEQLKNVMELAGMSAHCDYLAEQSFNTDNGRLRPDVILKLPGGRNIVIDAKTSMHAYLDALDAVDETTREMHLATHAKQIRTHMQQLSSKEYHRGLTVTTDFVAMFIPGENFFAAALERDPRLFDDAIKNGVLIVTPTTLIALAKAVAYGWRQEKAAENALKIAELGRDLYKRMAAMGGHVTTMGNNLERSVAAYNKFIGSLEGSVMPQARKFTELEVEASDVALEELQGIELATRDPKQGRDLLFSDEEPTTEPRLR